MPIKKKEVVKVQLTLTKKQMEIIRKYKDIFGESDAEIVRAIVVNWLISKKEGEKNAENKK
ncbi:MAG TPA: CopG family transcriptional regulator [Candidatus Paceibacterota bacterium]|nr:CopG family transcriptional regulator [Candidatus Paceibacterota bacterium]